MRNLVLLLLVLVACDGAPTPARSASFSDFGVVDTGVDTGVRPVPFLEHERILQLQLPPDIAEPPDESPPQIVGPGDVREEEELRAGDCPPRKEPQRPLRFDPRDPCLAPIEELQPDRR